MPMINVQMFEGRTTEQRRKLGEGADRGHLPRARLHARRRADHPDRHQERELGRGREAVSDEPDHPDRTRIPMRGPDVDVRHSLAPDGSEADRMTIYDAKTSSATTKRHRARSPPPTATIPRRSIDACGVGLVAAHRRQAAPRGGGGRHRRAEGGVASRRGRCRRQDRRRRRHPCRRSRRISSRTMSARTGHDAAAGPARASAWCSCRAPISARRSAAAPSSRPRSCACGYYHLRLAPGAGRHLGDRREGQRHAARDRADPDRATARASTRSSSSASSTSSAGASRRRRSTEQIKDFYICSLSCRSVIYKGMFLAEQLTRLLSRPAGRALRLALRDLPPALFDQHLPAPGSWRSRSACSRTTARSTRCKGNVNWMKSHEIAHGARRASASSIEDIKPVIQPGGSDSAALDNVFEVLVRGRPQRCRW